MSSLFPTEVKNRLLEEEEQKQRQQKKSDPLSFILDEEKKKNPLQIEENGGLGSPKGDPIANLYLEVSWSDERAHLGETWNLTPNV